VNAPEASESRDMMMSEVRGVLETLDERQIAADREQERYDEFDSDSCEECDEVKTGVTVVSNAAAFVKTELNEGMYSLARHAGGQRKVQVMKPFSGTGIRIRCLHRKDEDARPVVLGLGMTLIASESLLLFAERDEEPRVNALYCESCVQGYWQEAGWPDDAYCFLLFHGKGSVSRALDGSTVYLRRTAEVTWRDIYYFLSNGWHVMYLGRAVLV
jgi:hypothetical protein